MNTWSWALLFVMAVSASLFVGWSLGAVWGHGEGVICKPCKTHRACPKCGKTSFMA